MVLTGAAIFGLQHTFRLIPAASAQGTLDIRSFGARCDGSDDTAAVQSALNALSNGGTLQFSCMAGIGQVQFSNRSGVTIAGVNGGGVVLLTQTSEVWHKAITINYCNSCTIRDLTLDGNYKDMVPITINESSNTTVSGLTIKNVAHAGAAFIAYHNNGNKYLNNTIQNVDMANHPGTADVARGMSIGGASDASMETNVTVSGNKLIDISGTAIAAHGSGMTITGNTGQRLNWSCIKVLPLGGSGSTLVANNNCSGAGAKWTIGGGIMTEYFNSSQESTVIRDNVLEGYGSGDSGRIPDSASNGIGVSNVPGKRSNNIKILNNTIRNFLYDGVQISSAIDGVVIEGNLIERTNASGVQWTGISLQGRSGIPITNAVIRRNLIRGKYDGIYLGGGGGTISGVIVDNNAVVSSNRDGLHIEVSNGAQVTGVQLGSNCFSAIGNKTIYDNRGEIGPVGASSSCPDPTTGATIQAVTQATPATTTSGTPITTSTASSGSTTPASSGSTAPKAVIRVNAGGGAYTDASGNAWSADTGNQGGYVYAPGLSVSGTNTPALYESLRWGHRSMTYGFSVPNGSYTVTLKFAELYFNSLGQRVFNVAINGQTVLTNFDIVAAGGGPFRAADRSFPVNVVNGQISIVMNSSVDDPQVNAIEIR